MLHQSLMSLNFLETVPAAFQEDFFRHHDGDDVEPWKSSDWFFSRSSLGPKIFRLLCSFKKRVFLEAIAVQIGIFATFETKSLGGVTGHDELWPRKRRRNICPKS